MKTSNRITVSIILLFIGMGLSAQKNSAMAQKEAEYYKIVDVPIPDDVLLEVGGLALTDDDRLGVSTRHGEVWLIDKPYSQRPARTFGSRISGWRFLCGATWRVDPIGRYR